MLSNKRTKVWHNQRRGFFYHRHQRHDNHNCQHPHRNLNHCHHILWYSLHNHYDDHRQVCETKSEEECTTVQDRACAVNITNNHQLSSTLIIDYHIKWIGQPYLVSDACFKTMNKKDFYHLSAKICFRWPTHRSARQFRKKSATQCKQLDDIILCHWVLISMMLYTFLMMVIWSYFPVLNHALYGDDKRLCFSYDTINEQKCETVVKKQCRTVQEEVTIISHHHHHDHHDHH